MSAKTNIPLYLFAKTPASGQVKTRMQPWLSGEQSADLAQTMLEQVVEKVCKYWPGPRILTVTPNTDHPVFKRLEKSHDIELQTQIEGDLGQRMLFALREGIERSGCALVMGCDVPQIRKRVFKQALAGITEGQCVIGPAKDGGFYLLGLCDDADERMFATVDWGGSQVLERVCRNAEDNGIHLQRIAQLRDIDRWEDLHWLAKREPRYQRFIPAAC